MGKRFESLTPEHIAFIEKQHLFFVGTAAQGRHINISPKGYDTFRILSPTEVAYMDLTGSGNETSAHLAEDGRITIMFVAFEGAPNIMRLYGSGRVILPGDPDWASYAERFDPLPGARQIIAIDVSEVKTSCGYSIPFFSYSGEREALHRWAVQKGEDGLVQYRQEKNTFSMDGVLTPLGERHKHMNGE
ncbi:pyridoxamine 5'-phosphate oxidase family protein [Paenibacillus sp. HJGM_3]|uniref:pyridoxamine 5'-phosphate oxidase family protein n=1 Tax=Paenibacillus sp. HJGM_3 TaxID=3379816 RepID=UPI003858A568